MATDSEDVELSSPFGDLAQCYSQYRPELARFFQLNGKPHSADDLLQELFLALLKAKPRGKVRDLRAYVFSAAWNVINSANRDLQKQPPSTLWDLDRLDSDTRHATDPCSGYDTDEVFGNIVSKMRPVVQIALIRHCRDGWTRAQIAAELGCSVHAVKKYLAHALNELRMHAREHL